MHHICFRLPEQEVEVLIADKSKVIDDHARLATELVSARSELDAVQRANKKLKRRTARELTELERVAQDQCNRASQLSEELADIRREYTYLQARVILSN